MHIRCCIRQTKVGSVLTSGLKERRLQASYLLPFKNVFAYKFKSRQSKQSIDLMSQNVCMTLRYYKLDCQCRKDAQVTVAPAAGVAMPLLGPAALALVPLRYTTPSDSSGIVPSTKISRLLKMEIKRKPAKTVSERLSSVTRLRWFQAAPTSTDQYAAERQTLIVQNRR